MAPNDKALQRAAERVVKALVEGELLAANEKPGDLQKRIFEALRANFREEAVIEREAERILQENKRQMTGMDQRTLFIKIKEKLARDRGFVV